jgi:IS5 family transposase
MQRQGSFSQAEYAGKKEADAAGQVFRRNGAGSAVDAAGRATAAAYPKGGRGRPPIGLERMLRIYFLQQW